MLPVYFSGKVNGYYTTEKLIVDWTVLASLRIQHYYVDGVITQPISPNQTEEIIITIDQITLAILNKTIQYAGQNIQKYRKLSLSNTMGSVSTYL